MRIRDRLRLLSNFLRGKPLTFRIGVDVTPKGRDFTDSETVAFLRKEREEADRRKRLRRNARWPE